MLFRSVTDYYPFWVPYFKSVKNEDPAFKTKLCYNSKEFDPKVPAIRFFESELNSGHDMYIECCDWDSNFYKPMMRQLYKLKADPDWVKNDKYVKSGNPKVATYAVKLDDLELVNETSITEKVVVLPKPTVKKVKAAAPVIEKKKNLKRKLTLMHSQTKKIHMFLL